MVAGVTRVLLDLGANLEDASMTRLGGEFSMMLLAALPLAVSSAKIDKALSPLRKLGLEATVKAVPEKDALTKNQTKPDAMISVYGTDHPGIVHAVTTLLAKRKVNITDLNTKVIRGAQDVYIMLLEIQLPKGLTPEALQEQLDTLQETLGVEISLQLLDAVEL